jgi:hypothetical protein
MTTRRGFRLARSIGAVVITGFTVITGFAQGQMPDAKQMSGVPLPVGDLANGTVTVRVVRGAMTNPIPNQPVELLGGTSPATANTNDAGRAEFPGLQAGLRVRAVTTVDGQRLESQEFAVPATGGVRVALVVTAGQPGGGGMPTPAPAAARPGSVMLGDQTRIVIETGDEGLNVFNIVQVLNSASTPVQPLQPLIFDLPAAAQGAGMLEGSTPQATLSGTRVTVAGPFAPGSTLVQFAYSIPFGSASVTIDLKLPAALDHVAVVAQKVGAMRLDSPQIGEQREMPAEGQLFIAARGRGLKAGETLSLTLSGLPHQSAWPRNLALALAVTILGAGAWGTFRTSHADSADAARRLRLHQTRDRLFTELTSLEEQFREQRVDPERYAVRRRELVSALERIYVELDEEAAA